MLNDNPAASSGSLAAGRSFDVVREELLDLIKSKSRPVIALTGAWGTGKTFLWKSVNETLQSDKWASKTAARTKRIYVSLFGLTSVDELKWRLIANMAKEGESATKRTITSSLRAIARVVPAVHWTGKIIEYAASIVTPGLLAGRLIVFDDVERISTASLGELLGFVSEYSSSNGVSFLLILNVDELKENLDVWQRFREKVIDVELSLRPTPADAFDIAHDKHPTTYRDMLFELVQKLEINNIRLLGRILQTVTDVLGLDTKLSIAVQKRVLPTLVLFPAVFYHGVRDAPPLSELLNYGLLRTMVSRENKEKLTASRERARDLMQAVGIVEPDPFETEVAAALVSGIPNRTVIAKIVSDYVHQEAQLQAREAVDEIGYKFSWDPAGTPEQILQRIAEVERDLRYLDVYRVTTLSRMAKECGDNNLSDRLVERWIRQFVPPPPNERESYDATAWPRAESIDPRLLKAVQAALGEQHPPLTPVRAIISMVRNSGYGRREEDALRAATAGDFIRELPQLSADDLHLVFRRVFEWFGSTGNKDFNFAAERFIDACRSIVKADPDSKLAQIVRREFQAKSIEEKLT